MNRYILVSLLTLLVFWPIVTQLGSVTTSPSDGPLIAWLINHSAETVKGNSQLYEPPFFYPFTKTLTYSDPFVCSGLIAVVIRWLRPSITMLEQLNLQLILGTIGYWLALYWLIKVLGGRGAAALLLATNGTFMPLRFMYVVHLHTYLIFGIPLGLACLIRYGQSKKRKYLFGLVFAYVFQLLNAPMTAYFFLAVCGVYVLSQKHLWSPLLKDRGFMLAVIASTAVSVWFYLPYWQQASLAQSARTIRDAAHFSFSVNRLFSWDVLGLVMFNCLLFVTSRRNKSLLRQVIPWIIVTVIGLTLMLGPVLKLDNETIKVFGWPIPLPYAVVYYLIPGINAFRSVTRWSVVASLGLVLWSAVVVNSSRIRPVINYVLLCVVALFSIISARTFLPIFPIETETPEIYLLASSQPESVMAIFPLYVWSMSPYDLRESVRLLYQPDSHKTYYNGASGYLPPTRAEEIHLHFKSFPSDESIDLLKQNGVALLLVEYEEYQQMHDDGFNFDRIKSPDPLSIKTQLESRNDIQRIQCSYTDCLYRLLY